MTFKTRLGFNAGLSMGLKSMFYELRNRSVVQNEIQISVYSFLASERSQWVVLIHWIPKHLI